VRIPLEYSIIPEYCSSAKGWSALRAQRDRIDPFHPAHHVLLGALDLKPGSCVSQHARLNRSNMCTAGPMQQELSGLSTAVPSNAYERHEERNPLSVTQQCFVRGKWEQDTIDP
jgi:hypothetical protein